MRKLISISLLALLAISATSAQKKPPEPTATKSSESGAQQTQANTPTIHQLFEEDQKDRFSENPDWNRVSVHDQQRRVLVRQMLENGKLKTGQDFEEAAFIFQHGDAAQDYLLAHILAMSAAEKGRTAARWVAAATLDRYLQALKQPQVFGTQYLGAEPQNATQQPYDKDLVPDALRQEFCVTSYAGQQQNLDAMKHNKDFPFPDQCLKPQTKP